MSINLEDSLATSWPTVRAFTPSSHSDTYNFISLAHTDLTGKSVLITGASRGIGKGIALSFARAGASRIAIVARSGLQVAKAEVIAAAKAAGRAEPQVLCFALDVTSEAAVTSDAKTVAAEFDGSLDVLINNAGVSEGMTPFVETEPKKFLETWEVNRKAVYLITHPLLPLILKSSTRTILNVSSSAAHHVFPMLNAYQVTKFALVRFTEILKFELQDQGLVAISVHPGDVLTDLTAKAADKFPGLFVDTTELAGDTMVWLVREKRDWLGGRFISVTWDMEELERKKVEVVKGNLLKFRMTL
ncbi:short chain dehydrogenase reductase [Pseudomassariella vexata]|uniref:Short chain dehydrogenase reductase n=1 Tax=Pseudomassariella vexata TaxID=1141098 RepID=A0A1Y2E3W3_9PEZI|nr:short chain dehydrogenase reductase [Pseudomassariella vexata]ORY66137.1 short chain dehydrogenase reductase [Pseudomassariella vexata]